MPELTFGEQVKIVLKRKGMTIKELAERIEEDTGKKMSRQNLTQRLSRDNFQEQDMRMIAGILDCPFTLSILEEGVPAGQPSARPPKRPAPERRQPEPELQEEAPAEEVSEEEYAPEEYAAEEYAEEYAAEVPVQGREAGLQLSAEERTIDYKADYTVEELLAEVEALEAESRESRRTFARESEEKPRGWKSYLHRSRKHGDPELKPVESVGGAEEELLDEDEEDMQFFNIDYEPEEELYITEDYDRDEEDVEIGDVNPYTGREYQTNSVRLHPDRIGYVQVYDRAEHKWTDMTEWAFLGYQERKKALLGNDYEPPIYLD